MFSRLNKPANDRTSFVLSNQAGIPQAMYISNEHAKNPEIMRLLREKAKQGKLHTSKDFASIDKFNKK